MKTICLITGVLLLNAKTREYCHGDLFKFDTVWIVNANQKWFSDRLLDARKDEYVWFYPHGDYFERKSVFVFHGDNSSGDSTDEWGFSVAALNYMDKS
jgi:hypothetical protein